jgi:hypothetical protein
MALNVIRDIWGVFLDLAGKDAVRQGLFKFFLPLTRTSRVLVADRCEGGTSISMSRHVGSVICYCHTTGEALMIKRRLDEQQCTNVNVVVGDRFSLPFRSACMDFICSHHIPLSDSSPDALADVISFSEIARLLTGHGRGFLSFAMSERGSLLQGIKCREKRRMIKDRCTRENLSINAYVEHYPDMNQLDFVRLIKKNGLWSSLSEAVNYLKAILFSNNYGIIVQKGTGAGGHGLPTMLDAIAEKVGHESGSRVKLPRLVRLGSADGTVADFGHAIVRMPQSDMSLRRCENNFRTLSRLEGMGLPFETPKPMHAGSYNGQKYFVESKLIGISLDLYYPLEKDVCAIYRDAGEFLTSDIMKVGGMESSLCPYLIDGEFDELDGVLDASDRGVFLEIRDKMREIFVQEKLTTVVRHGDYKFSNFLCRHKGKVSGIIDWDLAQIPGLPLVDFLTLHHQMFKQTAKTLLIEHFHKLATTPAMDGHIGEYCKKMNISPRAEKLLVIMTIIQYINANYNFLTLKKSPQWYGTIIQACLIPACLHAMKDNS